jgi:type IV secretion system protein TrbL
VLADVGADLRPPHSPMEVGGCQWWNLVCQGGQQAAESGLAAITQAMINGLIALFGQITKIVDESTRVPLANRGYRDTYYDFAALAIPLIAVVFFLALISSAVHRDPRAVARATVGIGVAAIGGAVYVVFAQFLVAIDDWLAHGVVSVTGADFGNQMADLNDKFEAMGAAGSIGADALMLALMAFALIAGVFLWVVLLLRKMAILVVVAFAPILIVGWMWAPTRSWSRKATEVLIALVFSKSVIYMIFGIGMSLLFRSNQSLSDFVGVIVLLCGACFAPIVMLRLVHFAADSHLAGDMFGNLRTGATPALSRAAAIPSAVHRRRMANDYASNAQGGQATTSRGGPRESGTPIPAVPSLEGDAGTPGPKAADATTTAGGSEAGGFQAGGAEAGAASTVAPAVAAAALAAAAAKNGARAAGDAGKRAADGTSALGDTSSHGPTAPGASTDHQEK